MTGLCTFYIIGLYDVYKLFSAFNNLLYADVSASASFLRYVSSDDFSEKKLGLTLSPSSGIMYLKKDTDSDTSEYDRVLNSLKKLDTSYNPTMQKMHDTVIEGNYKVTGDMRVIPIVDHKDDEIQWACSMSISTDAGEPEILKEAMARPNGNLVENICDIRSK